MNKPITLATLVAAMLMSVTSVASAQSAEVPYVIDSRNEILRSGTGLCVRTGFWSPAAAQAYKRPGQQFPIGCECDKDLLPKAVC